jgi:hypothetical protein
MAKNEISVRIHYNSECINCKTVKKEMVLIGAFVMCHNCWNQEFGGIETIDETNFILKEKYKYWLKCHKNK